ncbi:MAG: glyoxylate/hydroxypyruvate reductase A [Oceanibaculum nanhaiense]|uniref:2-hydroxyacid dehydrogenase n=1 Tax=Oceanibaculum nanhaiense TaxID=1909734 RepID=UPI0025A386D4|nr:glyoxylate/hydroxypyruvate reductase A [Oceanibaculum nanhaiense]MDM7945691.1 glyoxylate/hydroxypyruvate reductase A [Oceanibaculum nanhaiense]
MALLFKSNSDSAARWDKELRTHIPDLDFRVWPDYGDPADIDFALVWGMPAGEFHKFPNLRCIASLGAGVDHIFRDPDLPEGVAITRLVDPWMAQAMSEYVLLQVLRFHRQGDIYARQQAEKKWDTLPFPDTAKRRVGILGLGSLGEDAAKKIAALDFPTAGWSRTPKQIAGVECYSGQDGLEPFLKRTDILCCLLPLTPQTENIIDAKLLATLPEGAFIVNSARGKHVVDEDLIAALDSGHIAGAALDVFREEPMPASHPYWAHPKVLVTPHAAALTNPRTGAKQVADNILRTRAGQPPAYVVDRSAGY